MLNIVKLLKNHGGQILVLALILLILSKFKSFFSPFLSEPYELKKEVDETRNETKVTLTKDTISDIAAKLHYALVEYRQFTIVPIGVQVPATDEDEVYAQLARLNNQDDYNAVYNHFGKVPYNAKLGTKITSWDTKRDLAFILNNELTESEKDYVKESFPHLNIF